MKQQTCRDNSRRAVPAMRRLVLAVITLVTMAATAGEYLKNQTVGGNTHTYDLINVKMKLSPTADVTRLNQWSNIVRKASQRIWNYTERQAALGKVEVYRRKTPLGNDILTQPDPNYGANANVFIPNGSSGLGQGGNINISETGTFADGGVLAHECGHYVFGCWDEYCAVLEDVADTSRLLRHNGTWGTGINMQPERLNGTANPDFPNGTVWGAQFGGITYDGASPFTQQPFCTEPHAAGRRASIMDGYLAIWDCWPWTWLCLTRSDDGHTDTDICTPNHAVNGWPAGVENWNSAHRGLHNAIVRINNNNFNVRVRTMQDRINSGESCWETAFRTRNLIIPQTTPTDDFPNHAAEWPQFQWILADPHASVVLCVDRTGSMSSEGKMDNAIRGANAAVLNAEIRQAATPNDIPGDDVGLVSFSTEHLQIDAPLQEMVNDASKTSLYNIINGYYASGNTPMGDGMRLAYNAFVNLNSTPPPGDEEVMILLTDGLDNSSTEPPGGQVLTDLRNRGVKIYCIALGSDADTALLQQIAGSADRYKHVTDPSELNGIFTTIYNNARQAPSIATISAMAGASTQEHQVTVDPFGNIDVTFQLLWSSGDFDLNLVKPDGTVIDHAAAQSDPNIEFGETQYSEMMRIHSPTSGVWTVRVIPLAGASSQNYSVDVSSVGEVNLAFNLASDTITNVYPAPLKITASFSGPYGVKGAQVNGTVLRPDGSRVPFSLYDDGLTNHGDAYAGDGQYANYFTGFKGDGDYRFEIVANNTNGMTVVPGDSPDFVYTVGSTPIQSQPGPAFTRQAAITINYTGLPQFINVTPYSSTDFASWQLDRASGAMVGSMVVSNYPTSFKTLSAPFWYALLESQNIKLANPTGITNGMAYIDITTKVNSALQAKYGRVTMQPSEWVVIDGVEIYSRDLSQPQVSALWALYADPPGGVKRKFDAYDFNKDGLISDAEILKAVHDWVANDMDDFALLSRIQKWKDGPHPVGGQ